MCRGAGGGGQNMQFRAFGGQPHLCTTVCLVVHDRDMTTLEHEIAKLLKSDSNLSHLMKNAIESPSTLTDDELEEKCVQKG